MPHWRHSKKTHYVNKYNYSKWLLHVINFRRTPLNDLKHLGVRFDAVQTKNFVGYLCYSLSQKHFTLPHLKGPTPRVDL
jgi:hypothetical protein